LPVALQREVGVIVYTKLCLLSILTALTLSLFVATGCDKLTTQINNNTYFDTTLGEECFKCHGDANSQIVVPKGQWANSAHASAALIEAMVHWDSTYLTSSCGPQCHTSQGFIRYAADRTTPSQPEPSVIDCFTCHMPHTGNYGAWRLDTLRGYWKPVGLIDGSDYDMGKSNPCVICHQAARYATIAGNTAGTVTLDSLGPDGPHSGADAQMVGGTSGYLFGRTWSAKDSSSHRSVAPVNGCLSCHYGKSGVDSSSGIGYEFGEHTFRLRDTNTNEQHVDNCNGTGCHASAPIVDFFASLRLDSVRTLTDSLAVRLIGLNLLYPSGDSTRYHRERTVPTDAARILYDYLLVKQDKSRGVHNTKYTLALLKASLTRIDSVPQVDFTGPETSCVGTNVTFTPITSGLTPTLSWDFGDGTSGFSDPSHIYLKPDSYTVTFTGSGGAGAASKSHFIIVDSLPKAAFTFVVGDSTGPDSLKVTFTNTSTNSRHLWTFLWDFGDGVGTSIAKDTFYTYSARGTYLVKLKATNICGTVDSLVTSVVIPHPAPAAPSIRR
jgi:PKD repeat protein